MPQATLRAIAAGDDAHVSVSAAFGLMEDLADTHPSALKREMADAISYATARGVSTIQSVLNLLGYLQLGHLQIEPNGAAHLVGSPHLPREIRQAIHEFLHEIGTMR